MKLIHAVIKTPRVGHDGPHLKCDEAEFAILNYCTELYGENVELRAQRDAAINVTHNHAKFSRWCFWAFLVTATCLVGSWAAYGFSWLIERARG